MQKYNKNNWLYTLYFVIARNLIKWCAFKPLYRVQCLIDCGKLKRDNCWIPVRIKWLGRLNYKLTKLSTFYGL
jgi:hypothetical protein